MAKIQLNGKKVSINSRITIHELLKKFKLNNKKVAIEHNGIIIPKSNFVFEKKDLVVFLTKREHLEKVESLFRISSLI